MLLFLHGTASRICRAEAESIRSRAFQLLAAQPPLSLALYCALFPPRLPLACLLTCLLAHMRMDGGESALLGAQQRHTSGLTGPKPMPGFAIVVLSGLWHLWVSNWLRMRAAAAHPLALWVGDLALAGGLGGLTGVNWAGLAG
ncbi:hypothetical protein B0T26DRAFT_440071 [Lasiosphaeria miniovina]|uniref:Uncharacterized protein n=1 Tax=Lasiosphaeria miniovina TaxID=1954250 RepID=A0AA39ZYK9_9PEZI|nr:uncharacterized protein B0T26DRAFT_440071 [Lasiosphaeria miniovina]KAK0705983.1 hypothetical protein B0T26DRAFT_440071 [Lasiosphaeria miniovina]